MTTVHTALMKGTTSSGTTTWTKLCCIKSYAGFQDEVESVETTTMCDEQRTYEEGLKGNDNKVFGANYDPAIYQELKALEGVEGDYALWFGANAQKQPDGHDGKFSFKGKLRVSIDDGDVGAVRGMTITIIPSTEVSSEFPSA